MSCVRSARWRALADARALTRALEDDRAIRACFASEDRVEFAEVRRPDRALPCEIAVVLGAVPERPRRQLLAARANPLADVGIRDRECAAVVAHAAHDKMHVWMRGVVVIDRHPFERRPKVALHRRDEGARVRAQVELLGLLGRDDHLPQPRVAGLLPRADAIFDRDLVR